MTTVSSFCFPLVLIVLGLCSIGASSQTIDGGICGGFSKPSGCPINCFRPDPVCGANGVTYWCGCPDAVCAGVKVVKSGACGVGNSGSASVPGQVFLLVHIVWLILLGFSILFGFF